MVRDVEPQIMKGRELVIPGTHGREPRHYPIVKKGALSFLTDSQGRPVSNGYHDFSRLSTPTREQPTKGIVIGRFGSLKYILRPPEDAEVPTEKPAQFQQSTSVFHEIHYSVDFGHRLVGKFGSFSGIIDETGKPLSDGYNTIVMRDGKLYGTSGSKTEEIRISTTGNFDWASLDRAQKLPDYTTRRHQPTPRPIRDHRDADTRSPHQRALDVTLPFWEREEALAGMRPDEAAHWARQAVGLPHWVEERFAERPRGRRRTDRHR